MKDYVSNEYDVIIIGGGPAGLSAALVLGRCRRNILIFDNGGQRNRMSRSMHAYLTRDGINPMEFLRLSREELKQYKIKRIHSTIIDVESAGRLFRVTSETGENFIAKKILLATGITDILPDILRVDEFYGQSIYHCPYCDGWEYRDKVIAVYSKDGAFNLALSMKTWSDDITLLTDGFTNISHKWKKRLSTSGVKTITSKIAGIDGKNGMLKKVNFINDFSIKADVMFFSTGYKQNSDFANRLGCNISKKGTVLFNKKQQTNVKGVFVAGDASMDLKFVIVAAAEGAKAAVAINIELQEEAMLSD